MARSFRFWCALLAGLFVFVPTAVVLAQEVDAPVCRAPASSAAPVMSVAPAIPPVPSVTLHASPHSLARTRLSTPRLRLATSARTTVPVATPRLPDPDSVGDAFGYGGLGAGGSGWGGGGTGEGTIGTSPFGSLAAGVGSDQGYGSAAGRGLRARSSTPLSGEAIRRVVLRNMPQVTRCYEAELRRHPATHGRLVVRFIIGGEGEVISANDIDGDPGVHDTSVADCITQRILTWRFATSEGGGVMTVTYPFNLIPEDVATVPSTPPSPRRGPRPRP